MTDMYIEHNEHQKQLRKEQKNKRKMVIDMALRTQLRKDAGFYVRNVDSLTELNNDEIAILKIRAKYYIQLNLWFFNFRKTKPKEKLNEVLKI